MKFGFYSLSIITTCIPTFIAHGLFLSFLRLIVKQETTEIMIAFNLSLTNHRIYSHTRMISLIWQDNIILVEYF